LPNGIERRSGAKLDRELTLHKRQQPPDREAVGETPHRQLCAGGYVVGSLN